MLKVSWFFCLSDPLWEIPLQLGFTVTAFACRRGAECRWEIKTIVSNFIVCLLLPWNYIFFGKRDCLIFPWKIKTIVSNSIVCLLLPWIYIFFWIYFGKSFWFFLLFFLKTWMYQFSCLSKTNNCYWMIIILCTFHCTYIFQITFSPLIMITFEPNY